MILVSISTQVLCRPACPRALISDELFQQDKLFVDIADQFKQYQTDTFRLIHGTATALDHTNRSVTIELITQSEFIPFHVLIIATGASTPSPLHGLSTNNETHLRRNWSSLREALPAAKRIVIAGGGPTAIETAGELGEYLNGQVGWFSSRLESPMVLITVVTSGVRILPTLRESLGSKAERFLARLGVTVIKKNKVVAVEPVNSGVEGD